MKLRETENSFAEKAKQLKTINPDQLLFLQALDPMNLRRRRSVIKQSRLHDRETVTQKCDIPDAELIEAYIATGNGWAFEMLYNRHKSAMMPYLFTILRNWEDAKDVLHNAWEEVLHSFNDNRYKEEQDFARWFKSICYHKAIDWKRVKRGFSHANEQMPDHADHSFNAEQRMENSQREMLLQKALDRLPENEKQLILLRVYQNKSFHEIGLIRHITVDAARSRYSKAVKKLKAAVS